MLPCRPGHAAPQARASVAAPPCPVNPIRARRAREAAPGGHAPRTRSQPARVAEPAALCTATPGLVISGSSAASPRRGFPSPCPYLQERHVRFVTLDQTQEFLVQPVDASWLQCNIECQEACPVGTNCRGYLNLAAEGRFEEGYILSREPNPVAAMCSYVCSAPCERACRRGDIDRPLAIRAMKRFLVEWHEASGIPDVMPQITPRAERVAVVGAGPGRDRRRPRARDARLPGHGLRQPAVRRRHDAHRRPGLPPAARGHRDGRPARRAAGRPVRVRHRHRHRHPVRGPPARLRRHRDHGGRDEPGLPRRARARTSTASSTASTT